MKLKRIVIFFLAICLLLLSTGFAAGTNALKAVKPVVLVADKAAIIVKEGQFSITLEENASTGYLWSYTADAEALKLVSENTQTAKNPNLVGAPSLKTWVFRAEKAGLFTLNFAYARSWEKDVPPAKTAQYMVIVEEKNDAVILDAKILNVVKKDGMFRVYMQANPSTGYSWKIISNKSVQFVGEKTFETSTTMVGAPIHKIWTFKALKKGSTTLKFGYANPLGVIEKTVRFRLKIK